MNPVRTIPAWRSRAGMPLLALLAVLLGAMPDNTPNAAPAPQGVHLAVGVHAGADGRIELVCQPGLDPGALPAPRTGRLRVRECDRLGPARLHLPPPMT